VTLCCGRPRFRIRPARSRAVDGHGRAPLSRGAVHGRCLRRRCSSGGARFVLHASRDRERLHRGQAADGLEQLRLADLTEWTEIRGHAQRGGRAHAERPSRAGQKCRRQGTSFRSGRSRRDPAWANASEHGRGGRGLRGHSRIPRPPGAVRAERVLADRRAGGTRLSRCLPLRPGFPLRSGPARGQPGMRPGQHAG
jgi:hypothetical protein